MRRSEALQGVRVIKFVNILDRYEAAELNQLEAAELLGIGERTLGIMIGITMAVTMGTITGPAIAIAGAGITAVCTAAIDDALHRKPRPVCRARPSGRMISVPAL